MVSDFSDALIVTESPTKAERIRAVCAERGFYPETASTGGSVSEVRAEFSPEPSFSVAPTPAARERVINLVKLARGRMVFVATDHDREGELTALSLARFFRNAAVETVRSDLRSMKKEDCLGVFYRTRELDMRLAYSAICRAYFDRAIGRGLYLASEEAPGGPFSIGRVKAAMLFHLADRPYSYRGTACPPRTGDVLAKAYDAGRSASWTYDKMQRAYEKGRLSYIRTDNGKIPQDVLEKFAAEIGWTGEARAEETTDGYSQEAHWCVYPLKYEPDSTIEDEPDETCDDVVGIVEECLRDALAGRDESFAAREHTEKSLIRFMQTEGVARPSTYVSTLRGLEEYVSKNGDAIRLNERGSRALDFASRYPTLSYATRVMETELSSLADGRSSLNQCMKSLTNIIEELGVKIDTAPPPDPRALIAHPRTEREKGA